ncbi:hypothetical protein Harman_11760 [Haloarcula mannanilytica]|uniref:Uncharacterized protein n=1 Tax=Haloarcula mannanilytica TaxID=2509225 RepID=A0A4C2EFF1_9EURY|nr:hypothetical protein [Haloarcula mannanilytica]GCF13241.1 hypothetical protein Harman_11760 [Haloarcula mannanilytica]
MSPESDGFIAVDGARRSDLSVKGWFGVGAAVTGIGLAGWTLMSWAVAGGEVLPGLAAGLGAVLLGGAVAYESATPEADGVCDHCGERVVTHSSRAGYDEDIIVHCSSDPRRGRLGPISAVLQRRGAEFLYCSGACAEADAERRRMTFPSRGDTETAASRLAATDGDGRTRRQQLVDAIDEHGSGAVRDDMLLNELETTGSDRNRSQN